jgi:Protein of unknown function (DUF1759)
LLGVIKEPALTEIKYLPTTEQNYNEAIKTLKKNHDKPILTIINAFNEILNLPSKIGKNGNEITKALNTLRNVQGIISQVKGEYSTCNSLLCHIIQTKFSTELSHQHFLMVSEEHKLDLEILEGFLAAQSDFCSNEPPKGKENYQTNRYERPKRDCIMCKGEHSLRSCEIFLKKNTQERRSYATEQQLCINCLNKNHTALECFSVVSCKICQKRHNTLLHQEIESIKINNINGENEFNLPTISIQITNKKNEQKEITMLADSGASHNLITENIAMWTEEKINENNRRTKTNFDRTTTETTLGTI